MMLSVILVPIECRLDVSNHRWKEVHASLDVRAAHNLALFATGSRADLIDL
jgi:hypothetical protein